MENQEELKKKRNSLEEWSKDNSKNSFTHHIFERGLKKCNSCELTCDGRIKDSYCMQEKMYYIAITDELRESLKKAQIESNFAVEVIMGEIAMTLIKMSRLHLYQTRDNFFIKEGMYFETRLNPVYEYDIRLQNHLNKLLTKLGIMPMQTLKRKNAKIAESIEFELSKLQTETIESKTSGANLKVKDKIITEKPIET
jgi:hypothetical protein